MIHECYISCQKDAVLLIPSNPRDVTVEGLVNILKERFSMKYILQRLCFGIFFAIGIVAGLAGLAAPSYAYPAETYRTFSDKTGLSLRMAEVRELWRRAGLEEYFKDHAFLWSEPEKTRAVLRPGIAKVDAETARQMGALLWEMVQRYPSEPEVWVLAGRYHAAMGQKDTARQLYRRALQVVPDYEPAMLGLADGYLTENLPDQALKALEASQSPEAALRKGVAHLAMGRYPLAVGYLVRAGARPGPLEEVRVKDLAKAYRAVGSLAQVKQLVSGPVPASRIGRVLVQDIALSVTVMERKFEEAMVQVLSEQAMAPEFHYWNFYAAWLQLLTGSTAKIGTMDATLKSVILVRQGQFFAKQGKTEEANQALNEALKADKRSLIGYLEAGQWQWKHQNYSLALRHLSKGLEVNPMFIPLLTKRAEIYEKLNRSSEAAADRAAIRKAWEQAPPFKVSQVWTESGTVYLNLTNDAGKALGIWYSEDGNTWAFTPWGRINPKRNATHIWLVPVGPGMSGSAARIKLVRPAGFKGVPSVADDYFELNLPGKGRVVVEQIGDGQAGASFVSERLQELQRIPLAPFGGNRPLFRVWYQLRGDIWQTDVFQLNLPEKPGPKTQETVADGLWTATMPMPAVTDFSYRWDDGCYQLQWRVENGDAVRVRVLTADGKWLERAVGKDETVGFMATLPENSRFCQLFLAEGSGRTVIYTDPDLNGHLATRDPVRFQVNGGNAASSRQVLIIPDRQGLRWSVSNDFRIWSRWFEGDDAIAWRIDAEPGRQAIFVRYRFSEGDGDDSAIYYSVVFVDYRPE